MLVLRADERLAEQSDPGARAGQEAFGHSHEGIHECLDGQL
jgi:hypothetical protein